MSQVMVAPDVVQAAAGDLESIGSKLGEVQKAVAPATLDVAPPAADEVSAGIARLFAEHAQDFHAVAQQATTYQQQFVKALTASGSSYAAAEDSIASLLQAVDANVAYYTTAGRALLSMLVNIPTAIVGFLVIPLLWPILPLLPFLVAQQFLTLFLEVLTGAPISYPYIYAD